MVADIFRPRSLKIACNSFLVLSANFSEVLVPGTTDYVSSHNPKHLFMTFENNIVFFMYM